MEWMHIFPSTEWDIIIHHSATKDGDTLSWDAIRRYHMNKGWSDIGYHFGIEKVSGSYQVLTGRPIGVVGAHTKGKNRNSIGICFVGNYDKEDAPAEMYNVGARLIAGLCFSVKYCMKSRIYAHSDFANKSCPGRYFSIERLRADVTRLSHY